MREGELTDIIQRSHPKLLNAFILVPWSVFTHTEKIKAARQA